MGCSEKNKKAGNESTNASIMQNDTSQLTKAPSKLPHWVEKGTECYGILLVKFQDGKIIGRPVKSKVIAISDNKVKMKALESINLSPKKGCNKIGISYGDTWWETEGAIFQTLDEANNFIQKNGWIDK
jgi:hypothetical protein